LLKSQRGTNPGFDISVRVPNCLRHRQQKSFRERDRQSMSSKLYSRPAIKMNFFKGVADRLSDISPNKPKAVFANWVARMDTCIQRRKSM
jgi:hypothetical protein